MIGRASIGNPWIFKEIKHYIETGEILPSPDIHQRVNAVKKHLRFSLDWKGEKLGVLEMRRHYTNYFRGYRNIKHYRSLLVNEMNPDILFSILDEVEMHYDSHQPAIISS
jgi:tRNA-dihydrouridine synthase